VRILGLSGSGASWPESEPRALGGLVETIVLQAKARPLEGCIEHYWFENEQVDLARTLFHRITIPSTLASTMWSNPGGQSL
jgi:hypothetical protein